MQGSDTMDYWFTRGEDRSEQIKKHIKEAAQSIIDHADDIVDQYDFLTDLKIEMNLNPDKQGNQHRSYYNISTYFGGRHPVKYLPVIDNIHQHQQSG